MAVVDVVASYAEVAKDAVEEDAVGKDTDDGGGLLMGKH
jgi:hypothetical protein